MNNRRNNLIRKLESIAEVVLLALLYYLVWRSFSSSLNIDLFGHRGKFVLMGLYMVLTYLVFKACDSFNIGNLKITDLVISQWIALLLVNAVTYFQIALIVNGLVPVGPIILLTFLQYILSFVCCLIFTRIYHSNYETREMVMVYGSEAALKLRDKFGVRSDKYHISKLLDISEGPDVILPQLTAFDSVIINDVPVRERNEILKYCYERRLRVYAVPRLTDIILRSADDLTLFDTPLILVDGQGLLPEEEAVKRTMDLILGIIALIPAGLVMLLIALAIKLDDGGPVFYRQKRVTKDNREFDMLKFRSMIPDAEKYTGAVLAEEDDPRITRVGRFLRKCRLDELPQVINIIKGDMSIVGPRPERRELIEDTLRYMPEYEYRTKVKGGLTGYAQVYGKYNTPMYDKLKFDLMYIENYSLMLDVKLILMTPQILFRKESTEGVER